MGKDEKADKAAGWPIASGDYELGDPEGNVAVCTLASETLYKEIAKIPHVSIAGPCKTENIGIEKAVVNLLSNSKIRFLIMCGIEVTGHVTGGSFKALWEKGIDPSSKKIMEAPGAIPYVDHLSVEAVERFKKQITMVNMMSVENIATIKAKIEEVAKQTPEPYPEPPYIVKVEEEKEKAGAEATIPLAPTVSVYTETLNSTVQDLRYKVQLIGRDRRLTTAVTSMRGMGIALGLVLSLGILTGVFLFALVG